MRAQRKPDEKAEEMIKTNPSALNSVSPATIMMTPTVMAAMIRISLREGVSRRKRKAKRSTKAREEDLHMADENHLISGWFIPKKDQDLLKKVRVMNLRLIFPRPISSPVAIPQGPILVT